MFEKLEQIRILMRTHCPINPQHYDIWFIACDLYLKFMIFPKDENLIVWFANTSPFCKYLLNVAYSKAYGEVDSQVYDHLFIPSEPLISRASTMLAEEVKQLTNEEVKPMKTNVKASGYSNKSLNQKLQHIEDPLMTSGQIIKTFRFTDLNIKQDDDFNDLHTIFGSIENTLYEADNIVDNIVEIFTDLIPDILYPDILDYENYNENNRDVQDIQYINPYELMSEFKEKIEEKTSQFLAGRRTKRKVSKHKRSCLKYICYCKICGSDKKYKNYDSARKHYQKHHENLKLDKRRDTNRYCVDIV